MLSIFSYLIGSIPTGFWFAKYFFNIDVTKYGSGNIGATNVARVLGSKKYFFLIFLLDFFKAFFALLIFNIFLKNFFISNFASNFLLIFAVFLLIGNAYSVFLKFKGGKGVATTLGICAFILPFGLFVLFLLSWLAILIFAKRVDVASVCSVLFLCLYYILHIIPKRPFPSETSRTFYIRIEGELE